MGSEVIERDYTIAMQPDEYRRLLDVLWYVAHQREKIRDEDQPFIDDIRRRLKQGNRGESLELLNDH